MQIAPSHFIHLEELESYILENNSLNISLQAIEAIEKSRNYLDNLMQNNDSAIYGVNTGFGSLCNTKIEGKDLSQLQTNLLLSHACGTGSTIDPEITKLMLLLKIQSLSKGYSGVQVETVNLLKEFYNRNLIPQVFEQGSLGASGDLAPLAHLCLPLIGEGYFLQNGNKIPAKAILENENLKPIQLKSKEGLALINGTQFMSAFGVWSLLKLKNLSTWMHHISALSLEAFDCINDPFLPYSHQIRPHAGQILSAQMILQLREGSEIASQNKNYVQDPYSFRCIPQVHGASLDVIAHAQKVFETEINSVTDNPNIFADENLILSAGNFHGQPLAMQLDFMAIASAELASISERRTYKLISGERGLPAFLTPNPGLNSGYMIAQYTAASIVSQNKQLCSPASVDSIVSSNGQEDHVSMGANAATKLYKVVQNLQTVLAIELICAAQAMHFRKSKKTSTPLQKLLEEFRAIVPFRENDVFLHEDINKAIAFLNK